MVGAYPVGVFYNGIGGSKTVGAATTVLIINKGSVDSSKLAFQEQLFSCWRLKRLNDLGLVVMGQLTAEITNKRNKKGINN